jgi:hypothetical protein
VLEGIPKTTVLQLEGHGGSGKTSRQEVRQRELQIYALSVHGNTLARRIYEKNVDNVDNLRHIQARSENFMVLMHEEFSLCISQKFMACKSHALKHRCDFCCATEGILEYALIVARLIKETLQSHHGFAGF